MYAWIVKIQPASIFKLSIFFLQFSPCWQKQEHKTHLEDLVNETAQTITSQFCNEILDILGTEGKIERVWAEQWMTNATGDLVQKWIADVAALNNVLRARLAILAEHCASEYLDPSVTSIVDPAQINAVKKKLQDWTKKTSTTSMHCLAWAKSGACIHPLIE